VDASRRGWGWHELEATWARRLVADARLLARFTVLDIGAGTGAITTALVEAGVRVIANPPFHVTAALLRRLLQPGSRLVSARLVAVPSLTELQPDERLRTDRPEPDAEPDSRSGREQRDDQHRDAQSIGHA
jgi:hypothetical protein